MRIIRLDSFISFISSFVNMPILELGMTYPSVAATSIGLDMSPAEMVVALPDLFLFGFAIETVKRSARGA